MNPWSIGGDGSSLVLGKHSGRSAVRCRLAALGLDVDDDRLAEIFERFKVLADRKNAVSDDDLTALAAAALSTALEVP
jgi:2-isopropylmalate synthase